MAGKAKEAPEAPAQTKDQFYVLGAPLHPDEERDFEVNGETVLELPGGEATPVRPPPNSEVDVVERYRADVAEWKAPRDKCAAICSKVYLRGEMQPVSNRAPRKTLDPLKIRKIARDGDRLVFIFRGDLYAVATPCDEAPKHPEGR